MKGERGNATWRSIIPITIITVMFIEPVRGDDDDAIFLFLIELIITLIRFLLEFMLDILADPFISWEVKLHVMKIIFGLIFFLLLLLAGVVLVHALVKAHKEEGDNYFKKKKKYVRRTMTKYFSQEFGKQIEEPQDDNNYLNWNRKVEYVSKDKYN